MDCFQKRIHNFLHDRRIGLPLDQVADGVYRREYKINTLILWAVYKLSLRHELWRGKCWNQRLFKTDFSVLYTSIPIVIVNWSCQLFLRKHKRNCKSVLGHSYGHFILRAYGHKTQNLQFWVTIMILLIVNRKILYNSKKSNWLNVTWAHLLFTDITDNGYSMSNHNAESSHV